MREPMDKKEMHALLRKLPSVESVLNSVVVKKEIARNGAPLVSFIVRGVIDEARKEILNGGHPVEGEDIVKKCEETLAFMTRPLLKEVVNATGIVIHTNLGRAPLGEKVLVDISGVVRGYSNLEYDLKKGERGHRSDHVTPLLTFLTKAEDAIVVNNNAAGIMLALAVLAKGREVIISRGELVEIGGSFRIPEILAASGAVMVEVGTTNKTRLSDYEKALTPHTALIMKAHRSNFDMVGFTEEVTVADLAALAHRRGLPFLYDIGSGLIRRPQGLPLTGEPDVASAIADGSDLVAFSGDKLLGGPQAGIVAGKKELIALLKSAPMMRALRVDKLTLAVLSSVVRSYFNDESLVRDLPLFAMLEQSEERLEKKASALLRALQAENVAAQVVRSVGRCGGGTLPSLELPSRAVMLLSGKNAQKERSLFAEKVFSALHAIDRPIVGILRQGDMLFDVLTLAEEDIPYVAAETARVLREGA